MSNILNFYIGQDHVALWNILSFREEFKQINASNDCIRNDLHIQNNMMQRDAQGTVLQHTKN